MKKTGKLETLGIRLCVIALAAVIGFGMMSCGTEDLDIGTVTISGTEGKYTIDEGKYYLAGQSLTANISGTIDEADLSYQWNRDGTALNATGSTSKTFTPERFSAGTYTVTVSTTVEGIDPVTSAGILVKQAYYAYFGTWSYISEETGPTAYDEEVHISAEKFDIFDFMKSSGDTVNWLYLDIVEAAAWTTVDTTRYPEGYFDGWRIPVKVVANNNYGNSANGKAVGADADLIVFFSAVIPVVDNTTFVRVNLVDKGADFSTTPSVSGANVNPRVYKFDMNRVQSWEREE